MPQDHADVVTAAAEHGEESIALGSFQGASSQAAVVFHVSDHRLNGAAPSQKFGDGPGDAAPGTADEDPHVLDAVASVSSVNEGELRLLVGQYFDLFQRLVQRVAVIGIARQRPHPDLEATPVGCGDADLGAKLVAFVGLALRSSR